MLHPAADADPPAGIAVPDRAVLNGVLHVLASGIPWSALPPGLGYGSGTACWRRYAEWEADGTWPAIERAVRGAAPCRRSGRR